MPPAISVADLSKTYATGFEALKHINLDIRRGRRPRARSRSRATTSFPIIAPRAR
jgi:hypothetical protein